MQRQLENLGFESPLRKEKYFFCPFSFHFQILHTNFFTLRNGDSNHGFLTYFPALDLNCNVIRTSLLFPLKLFNLKCKCCSRNDLVALCENKPTSHVLLSSPSMQCNLRRYLGCISLFCLCSEGSKKFFYSSIIKCQYL